MLPSILKLYPCDAIATTDGGVKVYCTLEKNKIVLRVINIIAILMTFGAVFPPLAVMICIAMVSYTIYIKLIVGRMLTNAKTYDDTTYQSHLHKINSDCQGAGLLLFQSCSMLLFVSSLFYSFFLIDMLGDVVGWRPAIWMGVTMSLLPVMTFKAVEWYLGRYAQQQHATNQIYIETEESTNDGGTTTCDEGRARDDVDDCVVSDGLEMQELKSHDGAGVEVVGVRVSANPLHFCEEGSSRDS